MKILYLGRHSGTSYHRAKALRRLGHEVDIIDVRDRLVSTEYVSRTWLLRWIRYTGAAFLGRWVRRILEKEEVWGKGYDLVHVDEIALFGLDLIQEFQNHHERVSCYVNDDPFGGRDGWKWRQFLGAVPEYDLITVVRAPNVNEAYEYGANDVMRVYFSADEVVHSPVEVSEKEEWSSEVAFIGTWFPERGPFMKRLIEHGIPLTIRGNHWEKAPEWPDLKPYWEGPALEGENYTKALQCAKICLGLLSEGNRDLHTQRSLEIPYAGSLLCAERTSEHQKLYEEGKEAVFWDDAEECADVCSQLLNNDEERERIARQGRQRCIENGTLNENIMETLVERVRTAA